MILTEFLESRWGEAEKRVASYREIVYRLSLVLGPIDHSATELHAADAAQLALSRTADRIEADLAAKRAIVALHSGNPSWERTGPYQLNPDLPGYGTAPSRGIMVCATCGDMDESPMHWPCPTLLALAQPYSDHLDFDPAWRVQ